MENSELTIKKGYKQTDVGIIPEDWKLIKLGDVFDFKNGLNKEKHYFGQGTPIVNYMDVFKYRGLTAKDIKGKVTVTSAEIANYNVRKDDVFFTRTSETVEEIGTASVITEDLHKTVFSGFILRARPKNNWLDTFYKKYCFSSASVRKEITSTSSYTTRALTNGKLLSEVKIPLPPLPEQQAIAEVLSDVDALVTSLDQLITKKRNIKQGAMQLLLTGKKRLAGFSGEWKTSRLDELGKFRGGNGFPEKYQNVKDGIYPFFKVSDMNNIGNEVFMTNSNNYISDKTRKVMGAFLFPKNTIIFAKIGAAIFLERKRILNQISCIDNNVMGFMIESKNAYLDFIFYQLLSIEFGKLVSTSALPSLGSKEVGEIEIPIPLVPEQKAIAQILSEMDAEIEALEQKRDKYKAVKQGMMQELLTGKTRLVN